MKDKRSKRKRQKNSGGRARLGRRIDVSDILDTVRQWQFPAEFRIAAASVPASAPDSAEEATLRCSPGGQPESRPGTADDSRAANHLLAECATCLWYIKTKHLKRLWDDPDTSDDDPRVRTALNRLNRSIEILKEGGIEVYDPTNKRYPPGGEGMMRPIQFVPTTHVTFEVVSETVSPVIFCKNQLLRRGEVFVAVPKVETTYPPGPGDTQVAPDVGDGNVSAAVPRDSRAESFLSPAQGTRVMTEVAQMESHGGSGQEQTERCCAPIVENSEVNVAPAESTQVKTESPPGAEAARTESDPAESRIERNEDGATRAPVDRDS